MAVVGVVPAAGRGARFAASAPGAPLKLLTLVDGEAMVRRTVTSLIEGGADRCVVVVSAEGEAAVRSVLTGLPAAVIVNRDPARGMFSSIQCGVADLGAGDRCVLLPGDMPYVRPETVATLLAAAIRSGVTVCPSHAGRRGHPLVLSTALRDRILQASSDAILSEERSREESLSVDVPDPGIHRDVDRPGDLLQSGIPVAAVAGTQARDATEPDRRTAMNRLRRALVDGRNADGGWGYYPGKSSRLEPTCWALLALGAGEPSRALRESVSSWFLQCQRPAGWLVEHPEWPVNIAFNALAAFVLLHHRDEVTDDVRRRLLAGVAASKGEQAPASDTQRQDNRLQGWSWMDATFSWVEPTCYGLLALKKARGFGFVDSATHARIAEAEQLLIDRTCRPGGWNFGNAMTMGQNLRAYVPTTALGLLAMQDRRDHEAVTRSLAALEASWRDEISAPSLALSIVAFGVYGRPVNQALSLLTAHTPAAIAFGNLLGLAQALVALSSPDQSHAFTL